MAVRSLIWCGPLSAAHPWAHTPGEEDTVSKFIDIAALIYINTDLSCPNINLDCPNTNLNCPNDNIEIGLKSALNRA